MTTRGFLNAFRIVAGIFLFLHADISLSQQSITAIRLLPLGSVVTTTGIITTGSDFGQIRYMQDADAGIALYSTSLSSRVPGDSIVVTGVLSVYKGQLQLSPVMSHQLISSGLPLPSHVPVSLSDPDLNLYESMRVFLPCVGISTCDSKFDSEWYRIFDQSGSEARLVLPSSHLLIGQDIGPSPFSATGIWTTSTNQFQLLGESLSPSQPEFCRVIDAAEVRFETYGLATLAWQIFGNGSYSVEYGEHSFDQVDYVFPHDGEVQHVFDSLEFGKIYKARLRQIGGDTTYSLPVYFTSQSPARPSIEVLFNRSVNTSFSDGSQPLAVGSSAIETDIISRIDSVISTLEVAMYNSSRPAIVQALTRAVQRGVSVRYLADDETSNTALQGVLSFPVLFRSGDGLMHHKFIIADAAITDKAWLWTGSTNFSSNQLSSDPNHAYIIKDQALAQNYLREFEEFWGNDPNHNDGRSGEAKSDNTAHKFKRGDVVIESYFSPSDETNCHIINALSSANHQVSIGLLLLTKEDLVDKIISLHQSGIDVRLIVEDEESSSLALSRLRQAGVPTAVHELSPIFHHKYAIIDEGYPASDPMVISGSHNWTFSADNINDENTLIIHDQSFTNIMRQEFEQRWSELVTTSTTDISLSESIVHPSPASDYIELTNPKDLKCTATLIDIQGAILNKYNLTPFQTYRMNLDPSMPDGIYLLHWNWQNNHAISKFTIQH